MVCTSIFYLSRLKVTGKYQIYYIIYQIFIKYTPSNHLYFFCLNNMMIKMCLACRTFLNEYFYFINMRFKKYKGVDYQILLKDNKYFNIYQKETILYHYFKKHILQIKLQDNGNQNGKEKYFSVVIKVTVMVSPYS